MPAVSTEMPAVSTEMPAVGKEMPAVGTEMPAVSTEMPAVTTEMPAVITEMPAVGMEMSAVGTEINKDGYSDKQYVSVYINLKKQSIMNQKQINKLEMYQATNNFLDTNANIWNAIPIIGNYKNEFSQLIAQIKVTALEQDAAQVFLSKSQQELKKQIADKMDIMDDILESYAVDTQNTKLLVKSSNSYSDYFKLTNEDFEIKVTNVISLAEVYMDQMADYGATAAQLEDVKTDFNLFIQGRGEPRTYKIASKVATKGIDDLFRDAKLLVDKLDNVLKRFKRSNINFYNGYLAARQIIDK